MAFFGAPIDREDHAQRALRAATEIVAKVMAGHAQENLRVGAGISTGEAFVGNVGARDVSDYTVLGDTVNIAARLQAEAGAGEILVSQDTFARVEPFFPNATRRELMLKGKRDRVIAWRIETRSIDTPA